eukprot:3642211-Rhodomonas_salina.4
MGYASNCNRTSELQGCRVVAQDSEVSWLLQKEPGARNVSRAHSLHNCCLVLELHEIFEHGRDLEQRRGRLPSGPVIPRVSTGAALAIRSN